MTILRVIFASMMISLLSGCGSLLPSSDQSQLARWQSFSDIKDSYDAITPAETTREQLHELGFDPYITENMSILSYVDLLQHFLPNPGLSHADLDPQLAACLHLREQCSGYAVDSELLHRQRVGNVWMDILNFRRTTEANGWRFNAILVLDQDRVVYKVWGGTPNIAQQEQRKNPLGPIQEPARLLVR